MDDTQISKIKLSLFLCLSTCLGIGLFRFSYTALLPSTRESYEWTTNFASILGSANLFGYLICAFVAMKLPQNQSMAKYLRYAAFTGTMSLLSCAFADFPKLWYIVWRTISGISGGLLMILAPSVVVQCCAAQDRLKINFIGFSGIGIGVLLATLFMPFLDRISTQMAWLILFAFALFICFILSYLLNIFQQHLSRIQKVTQQGSIIDGMYFCLLIVYSCSAFAYVPHSLFWIDYLRNTLSLDLYHINLNWILYGSGSALGAVTAYLCARKFGHFSALKLLYSAYVIAIIIAVFNIHPILTYTSSFFTGLLNPAVVFLTSYTIMHLYGGAYKKLWSMATLCFALTQLIGGLCFSALQHFGVSYHQQFVLAAIVLLLGTVQFFVYSSRTILPKYTQH